MIYSPRWYLTVKDIIVDLISLISMKNEFQFYHSFESEIGWNSHSQIESF